MKLSEIKQGTVETGNPKYTARLNTSPFWSLAISPVKNPFGLFSFAVHEYNKRYDVFMYKTSYYTAPVINKNFADVELEEVINWIDETLTKIKNEL
jgi:hypothetical protein